MLIFERALETFLADQQAVESLINQKEINHRQILFLLLEGKWQMEMSDISSWPEPYRLENEGIALVLPIMSNESDQIQALRAIDIETLNHLKEATRKLFYTVLDQLGYQRVRGEQKDGKEIMFSGSHADYDRIPPGTPGRELIKREAFRQSGCLYALSPSWNGTVTCFVPEGCEFSVHPPLIVDGFRVVNFQERTDR